MKFLLFETTDSEMLLREVEYWASKPDGEDCISKEFDRQNDDESLLPSS